MLASITPLGERGRRMRWGRTVAAYVVGSVLGGAAVGGLLGGLGALLPIRPGPTVTALLVALTCLVAAGLDLAGRGLPAGRRQVDEQWLSRYRGWVYGTGFGFQLGLGVVTIVTTATVYATLVLALLTWSVGGGLAVGATFGLARALPVLAAARVTTPDRLAALHRRLASWSAYAHRAAVALPCLVGAAALAVAGVR
jgi:sulfite exporter TauE/SafE